MSMLGSKQFEVQQKFTSYLGQSIWETVFWLETADEKEALKEFSEIENLCCFDKVIELRLLSKSEVESPGAGVWVEQKNLAYRIIDEVGV